MNLTKSQVELARKRLADFIDALLPCWPVVGGSVALVDGHRTLASFGFGLADRESHKPATPNHLFQVGSISKTFVSIAINQMVDDGLIGLEDDVAELLPWVDLGTDPEETVTIRALLSHTAGLILGGDGVPDDRAQIWALRERARAANPLSHFHYSNIGFMLLGLVVQAKSGATLADFLSERIFEPLGMESTLGRVRQLDRPRMATGYWPTREDVPWAPGDPLTPAAWFDIDAADGNVASSAADMATFVQLLLGDGAVAGQRVVQADTLLRILTPTAPGGEDVLEIRGTPEVTSSRYGLGVNVERVGTSLCVTHGGGMVGFQSFFLADRSTGLGIIALTNANGCYPIAQVIARVGHHLMVSGGAGTMPDPRTGVGVSSIVDTVADWLGAFGADDGSATVTIRRGSAGELALESGGVVAPLIRTWTGRYVTTHPDWRAFRWDAGRDSSGLRWNCGPTTFRPVTLGNEPKAERMRTHPLVGRYRSYTPWYPTFSIFLRDAQLILSAPGGVEAPQEDCELVEIEAGLWRIGAEDWLPERLRSGPLVEGRSISVFRDGVEYSRLEP